MQAFENHNVSKPLVLTPKQQEVLNALRDKETNEYPLSRWYHGALYALESHYNPDCIAQAAHSLRELLEKLTEVVPESNVQVGGSGGSKKSKFINMRNNIDNWLSRSKERYPEGWKGNKIDKHLAKALTEMEEYLGLNQQPNRRERVQLAIASIDPMYYQFHSEIQEVKRNQLFKLWERLEKFAHHDCNSDVTEFKECLKELEIIVFDLLAPSTAQDQQEIQKILNLFDKSDEDVNCMFSLIERKGANSAFFFGKISENGDVMWLPFLEKRGYLAHPPSIQFTDDNFVISPYWWPIRYLEKISSEVPNETIEIVRQLPKTDNPSVYEGILYIALQLPGEHSVKLNPKMIEYVCMKHRRLPHKFADLLAHWTKENETSAALQLTKHLIVFNPDPRSNEKRQRRKEDPEDFGTTLYPSSRLNPWEYSKIMTEGVMPLAEKEPYKVACLLIHVTMDVLRLRLHQMDYDKQTDFSEIWCPCLRELDNEAEDPEKVLVHTLTFACEKVYEKSPDAIVELDKLLRRQKWNIFKRLRQHLYALYPSEKTKPWIRELILGREDYNQTHHFYEFQQMIQRACEYFREDLLTKKERLRIFSAIHSGPSKEDFRSSMGEKFTEEDFQKRQNYFHRYQFMPFSSVLFGKYKTLFQELESRAEYPISDEDYLPFKIKSGFASNLSPRSPEELSNLTDEDLLNFINEWEKEDESVVHDPFESICIEELANVFQTVFRESIISDVNRLKFWMENRDRIERPIYVQSMICAMQEDVKAKNFDNLNNWLDFSEWVLTYPDQEHDDHYRQNDSREFPDWSCSRRAVGDFIGVCLEKGVDVPITVQGQLVQILETLCTQFDNRLKQCLIPNDPLIDSYTEGINSTRGRALQDLVKFGFWLRRHDSENKISEIMTILEKRFDQETEDPLTLPEYAILGRNYCYFLDFDEAWATKHKTDFFPQEQLNKWLAAFGGLVDYSGSYQSVFEVLRDDYKFALQHLADFKKCNNVKQETIDILGQHLFTYYLQDMYPLTGEESLLEQFYQKTDKEREHWGNLFNDIGQHLWKSGKNFDQNIIDRIIAFFQWRIEQEKPESNELKHFTLWLQADCLDVEWRLNAYSKILDVCEVEGWGFHFKTLCEMLPDHTAKVVECFLKVTRGSKKDNLYIQTEEAKTILKAGLNSTDESVYQQAEQTHDNLLRGGRSDLLDLED